MKGITLQMRANVEVTIGTRVLYDCPMRSHEFPNADTDAFFRTYRGRSGIIAGFQTELVGPLDSKGRLPGCYFLPGGIHVMFDGEDTIHENLNLVHFILQGSAVLSEETPVLDTQRAADLPRPILFYPDDIVAKHDDLLQVERRVVNVTIREDGEIVYSLAESDAERAQRLQKIAETSRPSSSSRVTIPFDHPATEYCSGDDLVLIRGNNLRWLYEDPEKMSFPSPVEELLFWARKGISETVYADVSRTFHEYPLDMAQEMVENGEGDIVLRTRKLRGVAIINRTGDHQVRRLLPCFQQYRERVRKLSQSLTRVPLEAA